MTAEQARTILNKKGITVRAVAEMAGVNPSTLADIRSGRIAKPSQETLDKIAPVLEEIEKVIRDNK